MKVSKNATFETINNEYTEKLEKVIYNNQLPIPDMLSHPLNAAYLLAAQLYCRLTTQYPDYGQSLMNALIHSALTDTLIDLYSEQDGPDIYPSQNILIYNTDDQQICYDIDAVLNQNDLANTEHAKVTFLGSTYYLFID